jgi:polyisoprenoid-binding protein YceI
MKNKYLEVGKFPSADLKVARAAITWPANTGETSKGKATADFTVHGVTKPVEVLYTVRRSKIGYRVDAEFKFDASAHGIAIPSEMGVTVDPKMSAKVTALDLADAP